MVNIEVYVDIVFAVNLLMDYFVLWMTAALLGLGTKKRRILLGAFAGSLIYSASLFINLGRAGFIFSEIILIFSLWLAFFPRSFRGFASIFVMSHIAAFAVGGISLALFYFTDLEGPTGGLVSPNMRNFSLKLLLGSIAVSYAALRMFHAYLSKKVMNRRKVYGVKIHVGPETVEINALLDTGNSLCEPFTKDPVMIVELSSLSGLLPERMRRLYDGEGVADLACLEDLEGTVFDKRLRLLPYESLGRKDGLLVGFRSDMVEISGGEGIIIKKEVVVGVCDGHLSDTGNFQALLTPELVEM